MLSSWSASSCFSVKTGIALGPVRTASPTILGPSGNSSGAHAPLVTIMPVPDAPWHGAQLARNSDLPSYGSLPGSIGGTVGPLVNVATEDTIAAIVPGLHGGGPAGTRSSALGGGHPPV